jgi:hypothetical protein
MIRDDALERLASVLTSDLPYDHDPEFVASMKLNDFSRLWEMIEQKRQVFVPDRATRGGGVSAVMSPRA